MASLKVQQKRTRRSRLSKAKRKAHNIRQVRRREEEASKLNQQEMMQVMELVNKAKTDPNFVMDEWEFRGSDKKVAAARALFEDMYSVSEEVEKQEESTDSEESQLDIWAETLPLTDELTKELIETGELTQEELEYVKSFSEDGEMQLEWNPKTKSLMTTGEMLDAEE